MEVKMIRPGMFISDRYEIIDKVGSGGMADVYKAKCHRLNRFVAIKILKPEYSDDKTFVAKFRGEAQSAAGLSHPNIVNVYDVGEDEGLYYIVMELVEGITLKSFIERKGKLEVKEAIGIGIQIAQGMEAAHTNHIIHRDIKPQNIIISREGKVKVTDFGIAKAATSNTITSNAMGSVHYISPEQARGGYSDEKSDIYSLGITLYEMLCGRVPFSGDNTVSVALLHIQGDATPLRELEPDIPVSVDRIVQKCMQKKPERRYLSVSELIVDLKKAITNPNGDFVKISPTVVDDSPTISLTDEQVGQIKNVSKVTGSSKEVVGDEKEELYEEEEEGGKSSDLDPKLERLMVAGGIVAAVILALIFIFLAGKLLSGGKKSPVVSPSPSPVESVSPEETATPEPDNKTTVPGVVGLTLKEALKALTEADLDPKYEEVSSNDYEIGQVIHQDIEKDTQVEKDTVVTIKVSSGAETFPLPDVYNRPKNEADTVLSNNYDLKVVFDYEYNNDVEVDYVSRTEPKKGAPVKEKDTITVFLSKGRKIEMVYVPDLYNQKEAKAIETLKSAGLAKGKVNYQTSDDVEKGKVLYQSYTVNQQVEKGTSIDITVSLGPEKVETVEKYAAEVLWTQNPFDFEDEEGEVKIIFTQDEKDKVVYNSLCNMSDFPLPVTIESTSSSNGTLTMYLEDAQVGEVMPVTMIKVTE